MFVLEALRAKHGDALLLHYGTKTAPRLAVIDAGPGGVFADAVRPRLMQIREERGLGEDEPLEIDLMMVSHLDADHITGILELMRKLRDLTQSRKPVPWTISRFWHNAFDDLTGGGATTASTNSSLSTASIGEFLQIEGSGILASVGQGRELRDLVKFFDLDGNPPFKSIVKYPHAKNPVKLPGLELTVVGPDEKNLKILQDDWNKKVKALIEKESSKSAKAELAAYVDRSVYNLSSIVVYAKADGKTMLLTGDARGDYTLEALRGAGLLKKGKPMKLDLLKLPHHGSDRNVDQDYFDNLQASHYVISADGRFTNPDVPTLEMISSSRDDDDFTIWLTNAPGDFADTAVGDDVAKFFAKEKKKGRKYDVNYRDSDELGVTIKLA
jgi:ribonuclease BN (tRNA processing enzyme)